MEINDNDDDNKCITWKRHLKYKSTLEVSLLRLFLGKKWNWDHEGYSDVDTGKV